MNKVIGDILVGALNGTTANGTNLVPGQAGNGIYFGDEASRVDYGTHQSNCFYDPDICSQGVTFAIWIKRDQGATGFLLDTVQTTSVLMVTNIWIYNHIHITTSTCATTISVIIIDHKKDKNNKTHPSMYVLFGRYCHYVCVRCKKLANESIY